MRERSVPLALESLANKSITSQLLRQTNNTLPGSRRVLMYLFSRYGDPSVLPALKDPDATVRGEAALSLRKLKARSAIPELTGALKNADDHVRGSAGYALGLIGDVTVMPQLRVALSDESVFVRAVAVESLQKLGDKTAKPPDGFKAAELFTFPIHSPEHTELYRLGPGQIPFGELRTKSRNSFASAV